MRACLVTASLLVASTAVAAGPEGRYAPDGIGRSKCQSLLDARAAGDDRVTLIAGWLDGYFTGVNQLADDVFDITPWQTVELLLAKMGKFCEAYPETTIAEGASRLAQALMAGRLEAPSPIVRVRSGDQAVLVYRDVLARVNAALRGAGYADAPDGDDFDEGAIAALEAYQADEGLPVTGLPDQATLNSLFP